jgi:UDP-glucose 4-epimerase
MKKRKIVVTGGAGFIGFHTVVALCSEGYQVMVVDDLRHACGQKLPDEVELVPLDIQSSDAYNQVVGFHPDAIIHLAAQGGVLRSLKEPTYDAGINVVGTVNMLKACVDSGCQRFVFASSGSVYGSCEGKPKDERSQPSPLSPYAASKVAGEAYLGMYSRTFGLKGIALRYANVYGPFQDGTGEAGLVAITCTRLLSGLPPRIFGDGNQTRDFVFVYDVVDANLKSLNTNYIGAVNIATGVSHSVNDVVSELARLHCYNGMLEFLEAKKGEVRHTMFKAERAKRVLGWQVRYQFAEGLKITYESFKNLLMAGN